MKPLIALLCLLAVPALAVELKPVDENSYPTRIVSAAKGKVLLVNFWATYCVPCRKEMPALIALAAKYKAKGFEFVTVTADEPEQMKDAVAFLEKVKAPAPTFAKQAKNWAETGDVFLYFISGAKVRNPAAAAALIARLKKAR